MSDVRLTATNPEDSSVVPVLCNAKGELKLEEPIIPEFDGKLDGDLEVTGDVTLGSTLTVGGDPTFGASQGVSANRFGTFRACQGQANSSIIEGYILDVEPPSIVITADGSIDSNSWATFTDKNVGFNANGELIFYSRNERYRAVAQGGNMTCEPYTREMELKEKAEAWADKDKLRPSDRDPFENKQIRE